MYRLLGAAAVLGAFALLVGPAPGQGRKERLERLALAREFKELDTNKDGKLSLKEFNKWPLMQRVKEKRGEKAVLLIFRKLDTNKDGHLSLEEFEKIADDLAKLKKEFGE
jgi:Ca2+-binding EF-hand superfamily protein